jgi:single-strand DNA-binding protein
MQTVIGRVVNNAVIRETKDGRKLVAFTVAQNDRFKVKGSNEVKQLTNYFNCSYWLSTGIAEHLKKGMLVEAVGRIGLNTWKNADGEARASLTLHVQNVQLHGKAGSVSQGPKPYETSSTESDQKEDSPF